MMSTVTRRDGMDPRTVAGCKCQTGCFNPRKASELQTKAGSAAVRGTFSQILSINSIEVKWMIR